MLNECLNLVCFCVFSSFFVLVFSRLVCLFVLFSSRFFGFLEVFLVVWFSSSFVICSCFLFFLSVFGVFYVYDGPSSVLGCCVWFIQLHFSRAAQAISHVMSPISNQLHHKTNSN